MDSGLPFLQYEVIPRRGRLASYEEREREVGELKRERPGRAKSPGVCVWECRNMVMLGMPGSYASVCILRAEDVCFGSGGVRVVVVGWV